MRNLQKAGLQAVLFAILFSGAAAGEDSEKKYQYHYEPPYTSQVTLVPDLPEAVFPEPEIEFKSAQDVSRLPPYAAIAWSNQPSFGTWRNKRFNEVYPWPRRSLSEFEKIISNASAEGKNEVTIPAGIYETGTVKVEIHLKFTGLANLKINARQAVILCRTPARALHFESCTNVVIEGLTIDYDPADGLPWTQGTCTEVGPGNAWVDVKIHEGYKVPGSNQKTISKVEAYRADTLLLKEAEWTSYNVKWKNAGERKIRLEKPTSKIERGDYVTMVCFMDSPHGLLINDCSGMIFKDVTMHSAPMFAVLGTGCRGSQFTGFRLTPGPLPKGGTVPRILSGAQDGIHLINERIPGAIIEGSLLECQSDDAVAIHSDYELVVGKEGKTLYLVGKYGKVSITPGSSLRHTRFSDMTIAGYSKAVSVTLVEDPQLIAKFTQTKESLPLSPFLKNGPLRNVYYRVEQDGDLGVGVGDFISVANGNSGSIIRSNIIRNHRARAMLLKTSSCLVEGNLIEHSQISAVVCSPEQYWMEADYSQGMIIRGNTFRHVGFAHENTGNDQAGIITIIGRGSSSFAAPGQHRDILIENNLFVDCRVIPFMITSASNVMVRGNKIIGSHMFPTLSGEKHGVTQSAAAWVNNVLDLVIENNELIDPGSFYKRQVVTQNSTGDWQNAFYITR